MAYMGIESVKFRGRHNSRSALPALILGILALIAFPVLSVMSAASGTTPLSYGIIGMICALVSLVGLIVSIRATQEHDIYMSVPIAGMIVNGIAFVLYVIIYVLGLV